MSKKNKINANIESVIENNENDNSTVFVRVVRNFQDSTDNNNFVSSGKNNFYRTSKERADKLVESGFCEYEDIDSNINSDLESEKGEETDLSDNDTELENNIDEIESKNDDAIPNE